VLIGEYSGFCGYSSASGAEERGNSLEPMLARAEGGFGMREKV